MVEILLLFALLNLMLISMFNSIVLMVGLFFIVSLSFSIMLGLLYSGWIGVVLFIVFMGGMLVMVFYLGMFGNYYTFNKLFPFFILLVILSFSLKINILGKSFKFGESSDFFFNFSFFILVSCLLFLVLLSMSKIVGFGSSLRRFF